MKTRATYKTKQRKILLDYFETVPGVHVTAGDVCEYLKMQGASIGKATVYRQLDKLVDEGVIKKYTVDTTSPACFEYVGLDRTEGPYTCFHFKCEKCGRLLHLHCEELEGIQSHLYDEHHLKLNPIRTVFYGLCDQCC